MNMFNHTDIFNILFRTKAIIIRSMCICDIDMVDAITGDTWQQ